MELRTDRYKLKDIFPERAKKYAQKLHVKADEIEYVKKGIPIDPADISIEEGERAAIRLITTPRLDRDGEILLPDGAVLDDFRQSPSVLFGHDYSSLPVGKDVWIKASKKGILAKTVYANHQFAEDVFQCVKGGFLNSNSVGFIPIERIGQNDARFKDIVDRLEKDYGVSRDEANEAKAIYTKWLLLEHSDVPVASNAQSLNIAVSKGELILDSKQFKDELGIPESISEPISEPTTDSSVQPKIDFCDTCGTPQGVKAEVVTKPETTDQYHRIPVSDGHEGHDIRTITVSEKDGIKALYCYTCKEIKTYLFDVDRFTQAEAEAWVEEHKKSEAVPETKAEPVPPAPDLAAELASLRADIAAVMALIQAGKVAEPAVEAVAEVAPDDIAFEPDVPDKAIEERIDKLIQGFDYKQTVKEAVEVALAKLTGKVI